MKNYTLLLFIVLFLGFTSCKDKNDLPDPDTPENPDPEKPDESENQKLFNLLDLNHPGLSAVKAKYEEKKEEEALEELLKYYRNRTGIINPDVDLVNPSISAFDRNVAEQALEYRFYIRNFKESVENGKEVYYSFLKNGKIDWDYVPTEVTDQEFRSQKHRHQWMLPQAKEYFISGNEDYVKSWIEVYGDWLKTFPVPSGKVNTNNVQWHALQPAERVISQTSIFPYFIQSENFTTEWLVTFLTAFAGSVETIRNNYYYTDASNIYVAQVQAVLIAGILMPEFKNSAAWLDEGATKIGEQAGKQFLEDGVQNELDPSYHISVMADFYHIYKLVQLNNKLSLFPANYTEQLKKGARFVMDVIFLDYSIENFNDTRASSYTKNVLLRNLRQYSEMFPDDEELKWMSTEGRAGSQPTELMQLYKSAGYYMLRDGWNRKSTMMIIKNNNNPENKWHCQPDNGTFALYKNGRNFTPDAGAYSYGGSATSDADRNAFRATKMHNTMTRNGADIKDGYMNGKFLLANSTDNIDVIVTENKSYGDLTHRRAVFFVDKTFFVLLDEGYGEESSPLVNLNFNLSPSVNDIEIDDRSSEFQYGAYSKYSDNNNMLFRTFVETKDEYRVTNNSSYISSKLQEKTAQRRNYQVTIKKPLNGAARFISVIYPFRNSSDLANINIEASFIDNASNEPGDFNSDGAAIEVKINDETYHLSYSL